MYNLATALVLCAFLNVISAASPSNGTACDCPSHQFSCGNCICIPLRWACDGDNDCGNHKDEQNCGSAPPCPPGYYTCQNQRCVKKQWLCDGDNDCSDNSDELDCPMKNCTTGEFRCNNSKCIPAGWRCDHDNDCGDDSDEQCASKLPCNSKQFPCDDGLCIPLAWKCDQDYDCASGNDEWNCHKEEIFCTKREFQCLQDRRCIPLTMRCDRVNDCGDGEDERGCEMFEKCNRDEFQCGDGTCIIQQWRCDGDVDCDDQSDEANCTFPTCAQDQFACSTGHCIPASGRCDKIYECPDNSDEEGCPLHVCGPSMFECDQKKCIHMNNVCDSKQDCDDNADETSCTMKEMLVFARRMYLQRMFIDNPRSYQIIPLKNISHAIAIDVDPVERRVYWTDDKTHIIGSAYLDGSDQKAILSTNISHPDGIAVDWIHRTIYWTDRDLKQINMADLDGKNRKTLITENVGEPRDIAVDPVNGHIYWSDWGKQAKIERADLSGENREIIHDTDIQWPNGIGLDIEEQTIYWGDARSNTIEKADFNGSRHEVILSSVPHVFGITVLGDYIYWTDWQTRTIEKVNKKDKNVREVIMKDVEDLMDIKAVVVRHMRYDCRDAEFTCLSGQCISMTQHCDGVIQCMDASDEMGCGNLASVCSPDQYHCDNQRCIGNKKKCNGVDDCGDNSDEKNCSFPPLHCSNAGCHQICQQLSRGVHCSCYHGYQLQSDMKSCRDINECDWMGTCSQQCENTNGSYKCSCVKGYILKPDGRGCKAEGGKAYLIFANRVDIRKLLPDLTEYDSILKGLENAIALDFHIQQGYVYWSDVALDKIMRAFLNGSGVEEIVQHGLQSPGGLAVDWVHNTLYWTDSGMSVIEVMDLDRMFRKILIWNNLEKPRAIVTHPGHGLLFWTDWGSVAKIERSGMDGSDRLVLANTSLFWPNGLTLDYTTDKLYWADAKHHVIECSNLDGSGRRTVINSGLPHPFALTLFEDELYWTDWHTKSINKANKFTGNDVEIVHNRLNYPMDIHSFHPQRQPKMYNRCSKNNGGCSHFCLPSPKRKQYTCACPTGQHLLLDLKTCTTDMDTFLLLTAETEICRVDMGTSPGKDVVIPLTGMGSPHGLDFDATEDMIYWTDVRTDTISRAKIDGSQQEVLIKTGLEQSYGIAVDWVCKKLYWTDKQRNFIEVANLNGSHRSILIWEDLERPNDIIVDPISGYMFWTGWGKVPSIGKAGMDGKEQMTIVSDRLTWPNGLVLDPDDDRLYWTDTGYDHIESCDMNGLNRKVITTVHISQPFGLDLYKDMIYWTDWANHGIHAANKNNGTERKVIHRDFGRVKDIRIFHKDRLQAHSECLVNNGGCSHLCLMAPLPRGHSCACPTGVLLKPDNKTCYEDMNNFLIYARRTEIRKVSLDMPYFEDVVLPLKEARNVIALDVDFIKGKVYWTDTVLDKIMRANLDGTEEEDVVSHGLDTPDGLAVDSVGQKIYWTDTDLYRIEVADINTGLRRVLIWENLDKPRAIALHPEAGYMYYSDWGKQPRIERVWMDGQKREIIIGKNLGWPNGLVIDRQTSRLIWADAKMEVIEYSNLDGSERRVLVDDVKHPYGLTVYGNSIYWTDWQKMAILQADKNTGKKQTVKQRYLSGLMDIHAVQRRPVVKPGPLNKCKKRNGGCSHLCLPNPKGVTCACPTGLRMKKDGKNCHREPDEFLLFASRGSISRISMDTEDRTAVVLPFKNLHNVIAVDYDLSEKKIYYTDVHLDVIKQANFDGTNTKVIISKDLMTTDGLAVDWIGRNLYWTDTGRDRIEVSRMNGDYRKALIRDSLDEPRAIALHPMGGLMFWTDWGVSPKIERASMDGSHRIIIVNTGLGFPNGLSVDHTSQRIYWVDAKLDKIETADFMGTNRVQLLQHVAHPFGLTVYGDHIYWTDWHTQQIERANKKTGKDREVIQGHLPGLMDIEIIGRDRQQGENDCSHMNGGCSHLCLAVPGGRTCECPDMTSDQRPCHKDKTYYVPEDSGHIPVYNAGLDDTDKCTQRKAELGLCKMPKTQSQSGLKSNQWVIIALGLGIIIIAVIVTMVIWRVKTRKRSAYRVDSDEFMALNFANPTYQRTSTETINLERASASSTQNVAPPSSARLWKVFRFNKKDQQVSILSSHRDHDINNSERAVLIHQVDSNNVAHTTHAMDKHSSTLFKSKNTEDVSASQPKVPYKPVKP